MDNSASSSEVSLNHNEHCLLNNPLESKRPEDLDREAETFAERAQADPALFKKAARLAQDPLDWNSVDKHLGLTAEEKKALCDERTKGFWHQPKDLKFCTVVLCFSAIIQGWVQSSINGTNLDWPKSFDLFVDDDIGKFTGEQARWIFAIVNAATFLAASLFGCWLSDPLQGVYVSRRGLGAHETAALGRRGAIFSSCCLILASVIGAACSHSWQQLLACRVITGLGIGAKASVTPIFGAEISPSHLRGRLVMTWQVFDACGILLGFTANLILYRVKEPLNWRFQMASVCLPTICLMSLCWAVPESPRWLLKQGRYAEAYRSMCLLRETPLQAAREIFYANAQLQVEVDLIPPNIREKYMPDKHSEDVEADEVIALKDVEQSAEPRSGQNAESSSDVKRNIGAFQELVRVTKFMYWIRIWQLFANPRTRRATIAAGIVMISQQLCGINVIAFYSTTFFRNINGKSSTGISQSDITAAVWMSWGIGWTNLLFTLPAYKFIDTRGRRFLLLVTYPGMIVCMLVACLGFLIGPDTTRYAVVGVFMYLFVICYSLGQGPVAFTYSSEVFPLINREVGMSFAVFLNFLGTGLLTLFVPLAQITIAEEDQYEKYQTILLAVFVGLNILAFILIFFFVRETKEAIIPKDEDTLIYVSLEELNWIFSIGTHKYIKYQVEGMLPYILKMTSWYCRLKCIGRRGQASKEKPEKPAKLIKWVGMEKKARQCVPIQDPIHKPPEEADETAGLGTAHANKEINIASLVLPGDDAGNDNSEITLAVDK